MLASGNASLAILITMTRSATREYARRGSQLRRYFYPDL